MHWCDDGIILAVRKHGESSAIVDVLTCHHGRQKGLVRGGFGRRNRGLLTPGNEAVVDWRARLAEHLGTFRIEAKSTRAALLLDDPLRLAGLSAACAMAELTLPEREPHLAVYEGMAVLLAALAGDDPSWPQAYVRWELGLLAELGFGLDLERCAASGEVSGLSHVSPRTGRAVSAACAAPYKDRLFRLPGFLVPGRGLPATNDPAGDILAGLELSGHFIERHVLEPHRLKIPAARTRLIERFTRAATISSDIRRP